MIAWCDAFLTEHESAWGLLQKLSWFNVSSPSVLAKESIGFQRVPKDPQDESVRNFVRGHWLDESDSATCRPVLVPNRLDVRAALHARCGSAAVGSLAEHLLTCALRVCSQCIRQGYHSVVYQLEGLVRCPIHGAALIQECPHCGHSLGVFGLRHASEGFRCSTCNYSFLGGAALKMPTDHLRHQAREAISPIIDWLSALDESCIAWPSWPPLFRAERQPLQMALTNRQALLSCLAQVTPCPIAKANMVATPAGIRIEHLPRVDKSRFPEGTVAILQIREEVKKAVESVTTEIRELCAAHSSCIRDARALLFVHGDFGDYQVRTDPLLCPVAQGFYIWGQRIADFYKSVRTLCIGGWEKGFLEAARFLDEDMRSSFYYCVQSMAILHASRIHGVEFCDDCLYRWRHAKIDGWLPSTPGDFFSCNALKPAVAEFRVLLDDPEVLEIACCDRGKAMKLHLEKIRGLRPSRNMNGTHRVRREASAHQTPHVPG